ncbi:hypothetical protein [Allonocardiopsis opalescens]|uniref:HicB-like protein involved in pilus formation n=1 Tax=Allonocardiopsis opalescens TaxID=1144618 RepID=A0A2T0QEN5_9ACTN|nr:hypothetical protein [Allonocardiopsis opalescens]PRY02350.1 hypothetical protein CLV72_101952 [Allonocardiopsis opalescens]
MNLEPYVDHLRRELAVAAEVGGVDARELAERLTAPLESAARLALLEALSAAAAEITGELAPGSVDVRLRGRDPAFVVTPPPEPSFGEPDERGGIGGMAPPAPPPPPPEADDTGGTSRISLRVPDHLKPRIEEAAGREGLSVNAWLVRAVAAALEPEQRARPRDGALGGRGRQRYTGWVR